MSRFGQFVLVAAAATLATVLVRALAGEALGSDAYSHLVWARDAVRHGVTGHAPFDYTVPKPFAAGRRRDRHEARRGRRSCSSGRRSRAPSRAPLRPPRWRAGSGRYPAAPLAALFTLCLPVLWRGGPLGDSNVPYAALVVGGRGGRHGHAGVRRPARGRGHAAARGLGARGHQRGARLAQGDARDARPLDRLGGRAAGALDHARQRVHGRLVVVEQHRRRLQRPLPSAAARPHRPARRGHRARRRRLDLAGRAARARGARRRPRAGGRSTRPSSSRSRSSWRCSWSSCAGRSRPTTWGGCSRRSPCSPPPGAAVALAAHNAGAVRGSLAVVAVAAVPLAAAPWLAGAVRDVRDQARQARALREGRRAGARARGAGRATSRCRASGRASSRSPGIGRAARSSRRARSRTGRSTTSATWAR